MRIADGLTSQPIVHVEPTGRFTDVDTLPLWIGGQPSAARGSLRYRFVYRAGTAWRDVHHRIPKAVGPAQGESRVWPVRPTRNVHRECAVRHWPPTLVDNRLDDRERAAPANQLELRAPNHSASRSRARTHDDVIKPVRLAGEHGRPRQIHGGLAVVANARSQRCGRSTITGEEDIDRR